MRIDEKYLELWRRGIFREDGYKAAPVQGKGVWLRVTIGEARKRQIRETCKQLGLPLGRILRIRIGALRLDNLKPRQ